LRSWYFELAEDNDFSEPAYQLYSLREILDRTPNWVCHNAKFDWQKLILCGAIEREHLDAHTLHDTQTQFVLLDENSPKGLKKLAVSVLKHRDVVNVPT